MILRSSAKRELRQSFSSILVEFSFESGRVVSGTYINVLSVIFVRIMVFLSSDIIIAPGSVF